MEALFFQSMGTNVADASGASGDKNGFFILEGSRKYSEPYDSITSILKQVLECRFDARVAELKTQFGQLFRFGANAIKQ